ncbi:transporter associated domain-containing protein [Streptomyces sp. 11x1]|uniref:hemolysin family protein n=1 Tax=Streptomyces sp. 11x1 TaxID=3038642 RepID=UPI00292E6B20|nr:transporter associated domain-containing protein [Streptomyces sp. 11x1]WNZ10563.1 transporter associated domain-containing protein [Streptomyces sp. 11x1]
MADGQTVEVGVGALEKDGVTEPLRLRGHDLALQVQALVRRTAARATVYGSVAARSARVAPSGTGWAKCAGTATRSASTGGKHVPLDLLAIVSRPAVWALGRATDLTVRLLGGDPRADKQPPTPEELRDMVTSHRGPTAEQRTIISSALEMHERPLRAVLVRRRAVFTVPADMSAGQARIALAGSGHSRAPVVPAGHFDEVLGVVHLRDLTTGDQAAPVADLARPATRFPDFMKLSEALRRFMTAHQQFALVKEIVGEIHDETDRDVMTPRAQPDGSLLVPGGFPVHDLPGTGVDVGDLAQGPYTTVAGLVLARLGHLPQYPGDHVRAADWDIEVTGIDHHAISTVRLRPHATDQAGAQ